jgi:hypothetical protein
VPSDARSTSSAVESRVADSSATGDTPRPDELGAGSEPQLDETESKQDVVTLAITPAHDTPSRSLGSRPATHNVGQSSRRFSMYRPFMPEWWHAEGC